MYQPSPEEDWSSLAWRQVGRLKQVANPDPTPVRDCHLGLLKVLRTRRHCAQAVATPLPLRLDRLYARPAVPIASILPTFDAIATIVAAVAALLAVYFARKTVGEAEEARRESRKAHAEEMAEMRAAGEAAAAQHRAEMAERQRAFDADLVLRRLAQLEQISALLLHLVEVARTEYFEPPPPLHLEGGAKVVTTTRLPALQVVFRFAPQRRIEGVIVRLGHGGASPWPWASTVGAAVRPLFVEDLHAITVGGARSITVPARNSLRCSTEFSSSQART